MPCKNHPEALEGLVKCARCGETFCKDCVIELKGSPFCATCKEEHVKDVQSGADTTQLELASVGRRFVALMLDGLILIVPLVVIAMVFGFMAASKMQAEEDMSGPFAGLQLILQLIYIGIGVVYEGVMLQSRGQTLGKMALKIKVVTPEGGTISGGQAWGRPLARYLMGLVPLLSLVDYLFAFSKEKTTLHDKIARTRVINWR
jgi:uncharacterized RDD family membrane protein YckC